MDSKNDKTLPDGYVQLPGSERRPSKSAKLLASADDAETFKVTIVLRRRKDGEQIPDFDYYAKTPPGNRKRLSMDEFAKKYGAHPDEIKKVVDFAEKSGLKVVETHPARRTVVVSGTVAQMNKAFAVKLGRYEHTVLRSHGRNAKPNTETYRGRDGFIHVPKNIAEYIVGVFGLDNRRITKHAGPDPTTTVPLSVQSVTQLYNFPANSAAGQTIAIFSEAGYLPSDISSTFHGSPPLVTDITVDAGNGGYADAETTQDICIAAAAAPGSAIAVYFTTYDQVGWVDLIQRVIHPNAGDPFCSVLSSSFYVSNGDDLPELMSEGVSVSWLNAVTLALEDAAVQAVTFCTVSGDYGVDTSSYGGAPSDGVAHVVYPGSDPWALCCGGTTIGNMNTTPEEWVWNDSFTISCYAQSFSGSGATGGGVSNYFPVPSYQNTTVIPLSLNGGGSGRGVPDVSANASPNSGYPITVQGSPCLGNGTSAAAPLWAGLIAVINAALGENVGFINPYIYQFGSAVFRDILGVPGPATNSLNGVTGYPAGPGWDACTGWGSPDGVALLTAFQNPLPPAVYISGGYQTPDIILTDLTTNMPVPIGGAPGGPWDTLLKPGTDYGFSAVVHNDSDVPANDVVVTFWAIPGGVGTNGSMVGTPQMVATIPPFSSVTINSPTPFTSAPAGQHLCAVVSIYSAATRCQVDAANALQIPDPGLPGTHACSAWRNTDSTLANSGSRFKFILGLGEVQIRQAEPVQLQFISVHIPAKWTKIAKVREIESILNFVGAKNNYPLYLLPEIKRSFSPINLKTQLTVIHGGKIEEKAPERWNIFPNGNNENLSFEVTGEIPVSAKKGDMVLVHVNAKYPKTGKKSARSIGFLEVIHVK
jgi:kumamolisin